MPCFGIIVKTREMDERAFGALREQQEQLRSLTASSEAQLRSLTAELAGLISVHIKYYI